MSFVIAAPEIMTAAATDLANVASTLSEANAAAAMPTPALRAAPFHDQFVHKLSACAESYAVAECFNVADFTANPAQTIQQDLLNAINAPFLTLTGRPLIGNGANGAPGTGQNGAP